MTSKDRGDLKLINAALEHVQFSRQPKAATMLQRADGTVLIEFGGTEVSGLGPAAEHRRDISHPASPDKKFKIIEVDRYEFGMGLHLVEMRVFPSSHTNDILFLITCANGRRELKFEYSDGRVRSTHMYQPLLG